MIYERITKLKLESSVSTSSHRRALLHHCHLISFVFPRVEWLCFAYGQHVLHVGHIIVTLLNCITERERRRLQRAKKEKERQSSPGRGEFNLRSLRGSFCPALLWISLQTSAGLCLTAQFSVCRMLCPFASILPRHRLIIAQSDSLLIKP